VASFPHFMENLIGIPGKGIVYKT